MTWSYEPDLPTNKDKVRLLIGDTDTDDKLLADEEIQYFIDTHGSVSRAAPEACRAIAAMYAREMQRSIGGLSANFSAKHQQYLAMARELESSLDAQQGAVVPYVSGYSVSAKESDLEDTDREPLMARKRIHDYPGSGAGTPDYNWDG